MSRNYPDRTEHDRIAARVRTLRVELAHVEAQQRALGLALAAHDPAFCRFCGREGVPSQPLDAPTGGKWVRMRCRPCQNAWTDRRRGLRLNGHETMGRST